MYEQMALLYYTINEYIFYFLLFTFLHKKNTNILNLLNFNFWNVFFR